jgi:hypothetical protein
LVPSFVLVKVGQAARAFVVRAAPVLRLGVDGEVAGKAHDLAGGAQADPARFDLDDGLVEHGGRHLAGPKAMMASKPSAAAASPIRSL